MSECRCSTLGKFTVVDMGQHEAIFEALERVRDRGAPYWWLFADLARERPGIAVSRLAWLLNLTPEVATDLARKVVARDAVDITFDA